MTELGTIDTELDWTAGFQCGKAQQFERPQRNQTLHTIAFVRWSSHHIEDAVNLPWNSGILQARLAELPSDRPIIVVCASGFRSHQASTHLDGAGLRNIYDMGGGMGSWEWETELCNTEPLLRMEQRGSQWRANWTPSPGTQDYDLLRGRTDRIAHGGGYVDLGLTECLADDTPYTSLGVAANPASGRAFFYLARQRDSDWGESSEHLERVPGTADCAPP